MNVTYFVVLWPKGCSYAFVCTVDKTYIYYRFKFRKEDKREGGRHTNGR